MVHRWVVTSSATILWFLAGLVPAQQPSARRPVTGHVLDHGGKPWPGATVTLLARPIPEYAHVGDADEVQAVTGADGACSASLLTFRRYSAWAHERCADGSHRLTEIDNDVCFGLPFELHERSLLQPRARIRIEGAAKATQWGVLTHRLVADTPRNVLVRNLILDEGGEADIPPLPGAGALYEVVSPSQVRLFTAYVPLTGPGRDQIIERAKAGQPLRNLELPPQHPDLCIIRLPEPTEVTVRVRSMDGMAAVASATIALGAQSSAGSISDIYEARPIGMTDTEGTARLPMLLTWGEDGKLQWPRPSLLIHSDTYGELFVRSFQTGVEPVRDKPVFEVRLQPGAHTVKGHLLLSNGVPAARVPVLVYQKGGFISNRPYVHQTDGEGRFSIPGRPNGQTWRITALVPFPGDSHLEEVYLHSRSATEDVDLGDVRVDELVTVHCHVTRAGGQPAQLARVYLGERTGGRGLWTPLRVFADAGGRAAFRVPAGAELALFAAHADGFAVEQLDVPADRQRVALNVNVAGATWVSGRVVDSDGKPIARARVYPRCSDHEHGADWRGSFLAGVCSTTLELYYRRALTDSEGRFRLPFADVGCTLALTAWKYEDDGTRWEAAGEEPKVTLTGEPVKDVTIVLKKAD